MVDILDSQIVVDAKRVIEVINQIDGGIEPISDYLFKGNPIPDVALNFGNRNMRRVIDKHKHLLKGNFQLKSISKNTASVTKKDGIYRLLLRRCSQIENVGHLCG
jgi:hypothetical protein